MTKEEIKSIQERFGKIIVSHEEIAKLCKAAGLSEIEANEIKNLEYYKEEQIYYLCNKALQKLTEKKRL